MKFTLDLSKWKCGDQAAIVPGEFGLGLGGTCLLNSQGYMCCLGQFSLQTGAVSMEDILHLGEPYEVKKDIRELVYEDGIMGLGYANTELSSAAIGINDDPETTIRQKVDRLTALFAKYGHEIQVINPTNIDF